MAVWQDWQRAWSTALYGPGGFVHAGGAPAAHFRTSVHVGDLMAEALLELLARVDTALGHPARIELVDLGAGGGELLTAMVDGAPLGLRARLSPVAVDLRSAPAGWPLPWRVEVPAPVRGLVVAHELLDAVPAAVVTRQAGVLRRVQVDTDGAQRPGPAVGGAEAAWLRRWGSPTEDARVEVGSARDAVWAQVLAAVGAGAAVAIDYGVDAPADTLAAYRHGRQVKPVPDGSCDVTAHVHWPSVQALAAGVRTTQRAALTDLGVGDGVGASVDVSVPAQDWLARAERAGHLAELTDSDGLGGFTWWVVARGEVRVPSLGIHSLGGRGAAEGVDPPP